MWLTGHFQYIVYIYYTWHLKNKRLLTSSHGHRLLKLSQRHEELRLGQLLIGHHGGQQRRFDHLIGGGRGRGSAAGSGGHGGSDGDLAELPGEGGRTEAAVRLQADTSVLAQQRAEDCRGAERSNISRTGTPHTLWNKREGITAEKGNSWIGYLCAPGFGYNILTVKHTVYTICINNNTKLSKKIYSSQLFNKQKNESGMS